MKLVRTMNRDFYIGFTTAIIIVLLMKLLRNHENLMYLSYLFVLCTVWMYYHRK